MGSTYGFNFRNFGSEYYGCDYNYANGLINLHIINLMNIFYSRRILISL